MLTGGGPVGETTVAVAGGGVGVWEVDGREQVGVVRGAVCRGVEPMVGLPNRLSIEWAAGADVDALSGTGGLS